jgi:hypothetical protein
MLLLIRCCLASFAELLCTPELTADAWFDTSAEGHEGAPLPPEASFTSLPGRQVLTLNMDVPESWLVEAVEAEVRCSSPTTVVS